MEGTTLIAAGFVDLSGLRAADEIGNAAAVATFHEETVAPLLAHHGGQLVKTLQDGLLAQFPSPVAAIECALALQEGAQALDGRLSLRIGVSHGAATSETAARLEAAAPPGSVCIAASLLQETSGRIGRAFEIRIDGPLCLLRPAGSEGRLFIQTLGAFAVRGADGPIEIPSKKLRALLAYLAATQPAAQSRETVTALLWGSHNEKQARQNLRQSLSRLKRLLGDRWLDSQDGSLRLRSAATTSDIALLEPAAGDPSPALLRRVAALSSTEFLPGLAIPEVGWSEWCEAQRRRVRRLLADACTRLARLELESGTVEAAIRAAERALEVDGLREDAFRLLAAALGRAGRGADAIARYRSLARHLEEELGTSPAPETSAVIAALRKAPAVRGRGALPMLAIPEGPSLAVLPFRTISGEERAQVLAGGLAEDIVTTLAKISSILVVARSSTLKYQDGAVDRRQVSREQGVRHVLEGAVSLVGDRVRVTAHLSNAESGREVWADRFDRDCRDFLDIRDQITKEIVSSLQVKLTDGEQARVWARGTRNTTAWENIVLATERIHEHHRDGIVEARRLAEEAARLDPDFAAAWAALGWTCWVDGRWDWADRAERFETARNLAERALSLDPQNPDALTLLGVCALHLRRYDESLERMESALLHAPGHAHIAALTAYVHRYGGEAERSVTLIDRAIRSSPVFPAWYLSVKGASLWKLGRDDAAATALREGSARDPDYAFNLALLAGFLGDRNARDEAHSAVGQLLALDPTFSARHWSVLNPYRSDADRQRELAGLLRAGAPA